MKIFVIHIVFLLVVNSFAQVIQTSGAVTRLLTCDIPLLAVDTETGEGKIVKVKISALLSSRGETLLRHYSSKISHDTAISFQLATLHAAVFLNGTPLLFEYELTADANVKGLSATLGFFTLILSMLSTGVCPQGLTATGLILPGGVIAPVGFLEEKIKVAINAGLNTIYVPRAQLERNASLPKPVKGVYTVLEVYEELLGINVPVVVFNETVVKSYHGLFQDSYMRILKEAEKVVTELRSLGHTDKSLAQVLGFLDRAEAASTRGEYYTASSLAFIAFLRGLRLYLYTLAVTDTKEFAVTVAELLSSVEKLLKEGFTKAEDLSKFAYKEVENGNIRSLIPDPLLFDILVNAYARLHEAYHYYGIARSAPSVEDLIHGLSVAYSRAITAETWLSILERLANTSNFRAAKEVISGYEYLELLLNTSLLYLSYAVGPSLVLDITHPQPNDSYAVLPFRLAKILFVSGSLQRELNFTPDDYEVVRRNVVKVASLAFSETGVMPLQPLLILDLVDRYLEYEDLSDAVSLLLVAFSHALVYIYMYRSLTWAERNEYIVIRPAISKTVVLVPLAVMATAGALLVFLSTQELRQRQSRVE